MLLHAPSCVVRSRDAYGKNSVEAPGYTEDVDGNNAWFNMSCRNFSFHVVLKLVQTLADREKPGTDPASCLGQDSVKSF